MFRFPYEYVNRYVGIGITIGVGVISLPLYYYRHSLWGSGSNDDKRDNCDNCIEEIQMGSLKNCLMPNFVCKYSGSKEHLYNVDDDEEILNMLYQLLQKDVNAPFTNVENENERDQVNEMLYNKFMRQYHPDVGREYYEKADFYMNGIMLGLHHIKYSDDETNHFWEQYKKAQKDYIEYTTENSTYGAKIMTMIKSLQNNEIEQIFKTVQHY